MRVVALLALGAGLASAAELVRRPQFGKGYAEHAASRRAEREARQWASGAGPGAGTGAGAGGLRDVRDVRLAVRAGRALQGGDDDDGTLGAEWPTEHADEMNSGSTNYIGPGDVFGFCRNYVIQSGPLDPYSERFYATGVTSMQEFKFWFGGGNQNVFRMIQVIGDKTFQKWSLNLETVRPNPVNATPYGIVASGSVWAADIADSVAMPSADGNIYNLWWLSCIDMQAGLDRAAEGSVPRPLMDPLAAERLAMRALPAAPGMPTVYLVDRVERARLIYGETSPQFAAAANAAAAAKGAATEAELAGKAAGEPVADPFPPCVQWVAQLGALGSKPSLSPTRYVAPVPLDAMVPLVLASESDPDVDCCGVLWAFNANSGNVMWSHTAKDKAPSPVTWGLTGVVPAVDSTRSNMVFLAYGSNVVALRGSDGQELARIDASYFPEPEDPTQFVYASGYLDDGDDAFGPFRNMTYDNATALCMASSLCQGFTFRNGVNFDFRNPYAIDPAAFVFFKTKILFVPQPPFRRWAMFKKPGFGIDPFVSSPVLSFKRDALFLHSAAGTLWKINIGGTTQAPVLSIAWGCDYLVNPPPNFTQCVTAPDVFRRSFPAPVYPSYTKQQLADAATPGKGPATPAVVAGDPALGEVVFRGDYVAGGWPQPTTRGQRDELYAAMRDRFLSTHSALQLEAAAQLHPILAGLAANTSPSIEQASAMMRVFRAAGRAHEIHSMRTRSGYTRLDGRGVPVDEAAAAAAETDLASGAASPPLGAGGIWYSVYPYSSPAQHHGDFLLEDDLLVLPQYLPYSRGTEGVFAVYQDDGSVFWSRSAWITDEGQIINFGRSRSSPAIDGDDYVYVAADVSDPWYSNRSGFTLPTLFAFDMLDGFLMWATGMGFATNTQVGYASPVITDGYKGANTAFMVADKGLVYLNEGQSCPSDDPIFECSRYGSCNCSTGICACDAANPCIGGDKCAPKCLHGLCDTSRGPPCACQSCWRGDLCDQALVCGINSVCNSDVDQCRCTSCFVTDATGACLAPLCGEHGTCNAGSCSCTDGYTGPTCANAPSGNAAAIAAIEGSTVTLFIGLPLAALGVLAGYLLYFRMKNPLKPLHAALPEALQQRLGFVASYSTVPHMPGTSPLRPAADSFGSASGSGSTSSSNAAVAAASAKLVGAPGAKNVPTFVKGNSEAAMARVSLLSAKPKGRGAGAGGYGGV